MSFYLPLFAVSHFLIFNLLKSNNKKVGILLALRMWLPSKLFLGEGMAISFERAFAGHDKMLEFRSARASILANNIANADTPNYKARDITFDAMFNTEKHKLQLAGDDDRHFSAEGNSEDQSELLYRNPNQPSLDGNTVDMQREQAEYAQNSLQFDTSFMFLDRKISGMKKALTGN